MSPLAIPHPAQNSPNTLFGLTGLALFQALPPLEAPHRDQKPRCLRLAIDHGDALLSRSSGLGRANAGMFVRAIRPNGGWGEPSGLSPESRPIPIANERPPFQFV